jgi:hypothetical protein
MMEVASATLTGPDVHARTTTMAKNPTDFIFSSSEKYEKSLTSADSVF